MTESDVKVRWQSLSTFKLSDKGEKKFLIHFDRCHQAMAPQYNKGVLIESGNNFPSDCGLASSASSFAALTLALYEFFKKENALTKEWNTGELALLSRQGSGSSCRSFFSPWVYWSADEVYEMDHRLPQLLHSVVIVDQQVKKVSSSEAHLRVASSELFQNRIERAHARAEILKSLLKQNSNSQNIFYSNKVSNLSDFSTPSKNNKTIVSDLNTNRQTNQRRGESDERGDIILGSYTNDSTEQRMITEFSDMIIDKGIWSQLYELVWNEFWDMHSLFETSKPSFYYMTPKSLLALRILQDDWEKQGDGPLITMDAGPNIHLLYRPDQKDLQLEQAQILINRDLCVRRQNEFKDVLL